MSSNPVSKLPVIVIVGHHCYVFNSLALKEFA